MEGTRWNQLQLCVHTTPKPLKTPECVKLVELPFKDKGNMTVMLLLRCAHWCFYMQRQHQVAGMQTEYRICIFPSLHVCVCVCVCVCLYRWTLGLQRRWCAARKPTHLLALQNTWPRRSLRTRGMTSQSTFGPSASWSLSYWWGGNTDTHAIIW